VSEYFAVVVWCVYVCVSGFLYVVGCLCVCGVVLWCCVCVVWFCGVVCMWVEV